MSLSLAIKNCFIHHTLYAASKLPLWVTRIFFFLHLLRIQNCIRGNENNCGLVKTFIFTHFKVLRRCQNMYSQSQSIFSLKKRVSANLITNWTMHEVTFEYVGTIQVHAKSKPQIWWNKQIYFQIYIFYSEIFSTQHGEIIRNILITQHGIIFLHTSLVYFCS